MRQILRGTALLLSISVIGCSTATDRTPVTPDEVDRDAIQVEVRNDHPQTMLVYAYTGTMRTQIGAVYPNDAVLFRVPESMLESGDEWVMSFHVGIFGGMEGFKTDEMIMRRGDRIKLRVAATLSRSTWSRD